MYIFTCKRDAHHAILDWQLTQTTREQINVVHTLIIFPQFPSHLRGYIRELVKVTRILLTTQRTIGIIALQAMISTAVYVESG